LQLEDEVVEEELLALEVAGAVLDVEPALLGDGVLRLLALALEDLPAAQVRAVEQRRQQLPLLPAAAEVEVAARAQRQELDVPDAQAAARGDLEDEPVGRLARRERAAGAVGAPAGALDLPEADAIGPDCRRLLPRPLRPERNGPVAEARRRPGDRLLRSAQDEGVLLDRRLAIDLPAERGLAVEKQQPAAADLFGRQRVRPGGRLLVR